MSPKKTFNKVGAILLVLISLLVVPDTNGVAIEFDLQDYLENSDIAAIVPRSNAEGEKSVLLQAGHYAELSFCIPVAANVTIDDVKYSNDGGSDSVPVFIDQELVGSFDSLDHSEWGHKWNEFMSSGVIGAPKILAPGFHKVQISINETDINGVELDTVKLNIDIPGFDDEDYLKCEKCLDKVVKDDALLDEPEEPGSGAFLLLQNQGIVESEDGQRMAVIDMFPRPVLPCRVVTVAPWYVDGAPGQQQQDQVIWQLGNQDGSAGEFASDLITNTESFVFSIGDPESGFPAHFASSTISRFQINFNVSQFASLFSDPTGLAVIDLAIVPIQGQDVDISVSVMSETDRLSPPLTQKLTDIILRNTWEIPLDTFSTTGLNRVEFTVASQSGQDVALDFIRLFVSGSAPQEPPTLNSQQFIIEAISNGPGANPDRPTMSVGGIDANSPVTGADAVSIKVKANGEQDTVPIFELTQAGVINMASPLLGELPPSDRRSGFRLAPGIAGIKSTDINPEDLSMNITFVDDSVISLRVDATSESAEFTITGASLNLDTEVSPLVRFETPWASDASNGADTIVTNQRNVNQLTNGWETLEASTVDFINRCGSGGEPTGSDWKIELLEAA